MSRTLSYTFYMAMVALAGCSGCSPQDAQHQQPGGETLIDINKSLAKTESERIASYIKRRNWKIEETGTGLRYMIYKQGDGPQAREGMVAKVDFEITLLDGTTCYSTSESGPQEFLIGMDDVESGLHEGITYMRAGDKAKLILPSHLAHGLVGDRNKIPMHATIIYDIELLALN